jgi:hypothetical protein
LPLLTGADDETEQPFAGVNINRSPFTYSYDNKVINAQGDCFFHTLVYLNNNRRVNEEGEFYGETNAVPTYKQAKESILNLRKSLAVDFFRNYVTGDKFDNDLDVKGLSKQLVYAPTEVLASYVERYNKSVLLFEILDVEVKVNLFTSDTSPFDEITTMDYMVYHKKHFFPLKIDPTQDPVDAQPFIKALQRAIKKMKTRFIREPHNDKFKKPLPKYYVQSNHHIFDALTQYLNGKENVDESEEKENEMVRSSRENLIRTDPSDIFYQDVGVKSYVYTMNIFGKNVYVSPGKLHDHGHGVGYIFLYALDKKTKDVVARLGVYVFDTDDTPEVDIEDIDDTKFEMLEKNNEARLRMLVEEQSFENKEHEHNESSSSHKEEAHIEVAQNEQSSSHKEEAHIEVAQNEQSSSHTPNNSWSLNFVANALSNVSNDDKKKQHDALCELKEPLVKTIDEIINRQETDTELTNLIKGKADTVLQAIVVLALIVHLNRRHTNNQEGPVLDVGLDLHAVKDIIKQEYLSKLEGMVEVDSTKIDMALTGALVLILPYLAPVKFKGDVRSIEILKEFFEKNVKKVIDFDGPFRTFTYTENGEVRPLTEGGGNKIKVHQHRLKHSMKHGLSKLTVKKKLTKKKG